ncbi:MAG: hypothetical protein ACT443_10890 [Gemmatimonadota bacterium]
MKRWLFLLCTVLLTASCNDDTTDPDDDAVPESELTFLRFESANAVTVRSARFYAVKGQNRELELKYADGSDFLEFEVGSNSLLRAPGGRLFQRGDSVLITVTLGAGDRMIVRFEPSGLIFNPASPAELEINYAKADDDIDNDGDRDNSDELLELRLRIWKQEQPGLLWLPQASFRIDDDEIEALIFSFTGFAMAS